MPTCRLPALPIAARLLAAAILVVPGWARAGEGPGDESHPSLREALRAGLALGGGSAKNQILSNLGQELARARLFPEALAAADGIDSDARRSDLRQFVAKQLAIAGRVEESLKMAAGLNQPQQPQALDWVIQDAAAEQARAGDLDGALGTARLCRRPEMVRWVLGAVMEARAGAGDLAGVRRAAAAFDGPMPRPASEKVEAVADVATLLAKWGDLDAANRLADEFEPDGAVILSAIAEARSGAGDLKAAADLARRAMGRNPDWEREAAARVILVRDHAARGDIAGAMQLAAGPWKDPVFPPEERVFPMPSLAPYRREAALAIARAAASAGHVEVANTALARLPVQSRVAILLELAEDCGRRGDDPAAGRFLDDAERLAESEKLGFPLGDIGAAQYRLGRRDAARESFARAMRGKDVGSPVNQRVIVASQARAGDIGGLDRTVALIEDPGLRDQARAWAAASLMSWVRADAALAMAGTIAAVPIRATCLAQLGKALADAGDLAGGHAACRRAADTAAAARPLPPEAARILAHAWASLPDGLAEARAWAHSLGDAEARASALLGIALGELGREVEAGPHSRFFVPMPPGQAARNRRAPGQSVR